MCASLPDQRPEQIVPHYAKLLDAVQQAIVGATPERLTNYWGRFAAQLYGWTAEEALGRPISERERTELALATANSRLTILNNELRQLLDLFRPSQQLRQPIDINALIERILLLTGRTLSQQQIVARYDLDPQLPPLWGQANELMQVILNLVVNAAHAMAAGGTLTLRTTSRSAGQPNRQLVIEIADSGSGMTPEVQARIFEPFFTTKADGSGLGLAISKQIIERHSGTIAVRSELSVGSTFELRLPVSELAKESC